jgi:hypothetical protein
LLASACTTATIAASASADVPVTFTARGELDCISYYGCQAVLSVLSLPAGATPPPTWYEHARVEFRTVSEDWHRLAGPPIDPPTSIGPGDYVVVAGTRFTSDVSSHDPEGNVVFQEMGANTCEATLDVDPGTAAVSIELDVDARGVPCAVAVMVE